MALLVVAFVVVPIIELAVIIQVGHWLGVWETLTLLVMVSFLGAWLVKRQGAGTLRRIRTELAVGRVPATALVDGALVLVAGVLLLTPGFVTDLVGLALLAPPARALVRGGLVRRFRAVGTVAGNG